MVSIGSAIPEHRVWRMPWMVSQQPVRRPQYLEAQPLGLGKTRATKNVHHAVSRLAQNPAV